MISKSTLLSVLQVKGGAGRNSGSEGGTTYFGSLITAPGGTGGGAGGASANTSYIQGISWGASPTSSGTVLRAFRCSAKTPGAMVISVKAVAGGTENIHHYSQAV